MKNGNTEHDLDSIAQLLHRQNAVLDVLLGHLAGIEGTLGVLTLKTLSGENLCRAKAMKDCIQSMIYDQMIAEIERKLEEL